MSVTTATKQTTSNSDPSRHVGSVKWYDAIRGYGFLRDDRGGDVFMHRADVEGDLDRDPKAGDRLSFTLRDARNGRQCAADLKPLAE